MTRVATRALALIVGLVLLVVLLFAANQPTADAACDPTGAAVSVVDPDSIPKGPIAGFKGEQLENAAAIMLAAKDKGLSRRDQQIGVMTAIGESTLMPLGHGDAAGPDSRGLFQQRASWGSEADRMDPYKSAVLFFDALVKVQGRDSLEPTLVAHQVQANRDPWHYEQHWAAAGQIVDALSGVKPASTSSLGSSSPGQNASSYDLGPVKPQTVALANTVGPRFHIKTVGGWRPTDPFPDHPSGLAADFMVPLNSAGQETGDALAAYVQANAQALGVDYIIWNQRIWSVARNDEGWRAMEDRGSPTANHRDHVHVTLNANASASPTGELTSCAVGAGSTGPATKDGWTAPSKGTIGSGFGPREAPTAGASTYHKGVDWSAGCDAPIYAANSGHVITAGPASGFGHWIQIDHGDGVITTYGHMYADGIKVAVGDTVKSGQHIADEGSDGTSTGCHLHFEVARNGEKIDPRAFLTEQGLNLI